MLQCHSVGGQVPPRSTKDLPRDFGAHIAQSLLHDFVEENTQAVRVLHPVGDVPEPVPHKTWHFHALVRFSVQHQSLGLDMQAVARFVLTSHTEDVTLETMVDWLVGDVAKSLPQFPKWVCLLCFEEEQHSKIAAVRLVRLKLAYIYE